MEKQTLEENILQLHNKIANFQNNFVEASCAFVPSPLAQANAQLEVALQNEARTKSRVSELDTENNKLQVHLLDKETKEKQLQDQLNTRIKELEAELLAEKKVSQTNSHLHEQKMAALIQKNQELEEALRNAENVRLRAELNQANQKYDDLLKEFNKKEENKDVKTESNVLKCENQDLREDNNQTENTEEEVVNRTVDQASKCEDLEKSKSPTHSFRNS
ncbi:hypothetical protein WMY93_008182 [Mugilogobius chulae]|uniref:Uncharacterized protein n=1 Tax=Mugilogobius chulae TaxID=88201 RepID=A0AAW0PK60_9GOBI